jgi:lysophospholipase L1-like esterase
MLALTVLTLSVATPARAAEAVHYVALGDSAAAGPLIPHRHGPLICLRSDHNYPSLVAGGLHVADFKDVSCSGATIANLTKAQLGLRPQVDSLSAETTLVTLTIGANSAGWAKLAVMCGLRSLEAGSPCTDLDDGAILRRIDGLAKPYADGFSAIRAKAPNAQIVVAGYLRMTPEGGRSCWPRIPLAKGDLPYVDEAERRLNAQLRKSAEAAGATYVDVYGMSIGHDACAADPWVNGLISAQWGAVYHPNAVGMRQIGRRIVETLSASSRAAGTAPSWS